MATEYVSWKTGDASKPKPQIVKPNEWVTVQFNEGAAIVPKNSGTANWAFYLNIKNASGLGASKSVDVRFLRDPKGIADFTGQCNLDLTSGSIYSGTWFFNAKKGQPVALQIRNNGKKNITLSTREFKMWIP
ncbi:hypothetical protein UFOVP1264_33 [uncultured Caudovirales phage]|uniref:Uncharacterized protein n=1 Tax=uncultured Caudovirales phage TaxID=2100421 RepID=A0A6J5RLJ6_9CAUD|nr:hypothetical protein UFOVP1264_33 [uncultured Caudovirales phage]